MTETLPSGQALFGDVAGTVDWVSVFYDTAELGADYVTLVGPQNNDLAIFLFTTEKGKKAGVATPAFFPFSVVNKKMARSLFCGPTRVT